MSSNTMNTHILSALETIEAQVALLRTQLNAMSEAKTTSSSTKVKKSSAKKTKAEVAAEQSASETEKVEKPKKPINDKIAAMNVERKAIFSEMKAAWAKSHPTYAAYFSEDCPADLKKAVKEAVKAGTLERPPSYPDALKEHSKRLGEQDPAHAAKAEERRRKMEEKKEKTKETKTSVKDGETNTTVSTESESKKKRGPKAGYKLTEEQKAERAAARKRNAELKNTTALPPLPDSPPSSEEEESKEDSSQEDAYKITHVNLAVNKGKTLVFKSVKVWLDASGGAYAVSPGNSFGEWLGKYDSATASFIPCPAPQ